jgi:hypothetical protein
MVGPVRKSPGILTTWLLPAVFTRCGMPAKSNCPDAAMAVRYRHNIPAGRFAADTANQPPNGPAK